jgi:toxin ParE1/3/4
VASVVWTRSALSDLREIVEYVAENSPANAESVRVRVVRAPRTLAANPRFGARVPEFDRDDLREVFAAPYRIVYWIDGLDDCHVVAIVRGARDPGSAFSATDLIGRAQPPEPLDNPSAQ